MLSVEQTFQKNAFFHIHMLKIFILVILKIFIFSNFYMNIAVKYFVNNYEKITIMAVDVFCIIN